MKKTIKKLYMLFLHPILFFTNTFKNNLFVRSGQIKRINKMNIGKNISFGRDTRINFYDKENDKKLYIGDGSYFCNRVTILCGGKIVIGRNVLVASDVCFFAENHSIDANSSVPYMKQDLKFKDVYVGDGAWIGEKAIILPGVELGKRCVVAAGAVVTKSFPAYSLVGGVPAKVIKKYNFDNHLWESVDEKEI